MNTLIDGLIVFAYVFGSAELYKSAIRQFVLSMARHREDEVISANKAGQRCICGRLLAPGSKRCPPAMKTNLRIGLPPDGTE